MHEFDSITGFLWTALGAVGGVVKVILDLLDRQQLPTPWGIFWLLMANAFVSGFSGFMGAVVMSGITANDNYHVVAAGVAGYMGVRALELLSSWYKERVAIQN